MRRGFTLIELLAVIVILAIIALIAVPIVLNIIEDVKEKAIIRSAENYISALELEITNKNLKGEYNPTECSINIENNKRLECYYNGEQLEPINLEIEGEYLTSGIITLKDGKVNKINAGKIPGLKKDEYIYYENNVISVKVPPSSALKTGQEFNKTLKQFVNPSANYSTKDETITNIEFYPLEMLPSGYTKLSLNNLSHERVSKDNDDSIVAYYDSNKTTVYILSDNKISMDENSAYLFYNFSKLENINNLNLINTSKVTTINGMFMGCTSLLSINLSNYDTSKVIDMREVFNGCSSLTSLDLSNFDTSKVTNMYGMFSRCSSLKNLDVSKFDTSNVTTMFGMFRDCSLLTSLDVAHFNTSKVTDISHMFRNCSLLTSLDINSIDTSKVTTINGMFSGCKNLLSINLSNFDTSKVIDMREVFNGCSSLTSLDLSSFNTSKVTNMYGMFSGCKNLIDIKFNKATFNQVTTYTNMFYNIPNTINIEVKDNGAKDFVEARLTDAGKNGYTITCANGSC